MQVDEVAARQQVDATVTVLKSVHEEAVKNRDRIPDAPVSVSYALLGLAAEHYQADQITDAMASVIAAWQGDDGAFYPLPPMRPPLEAGHFTATALSLRALQLYGTHSEEPVARASRWLRSANPRTTEERAMQLLGLAWSEAPAEDIRKSAAALLAGATARWWMGAASLARNRCVRHRTGARGAADGRTRRLERRVPARCRVSSADAVPRRFVAGPHPHVSRPAAARQRVPARKESVDFRRRYELGGDGALAVPGAGTALGIGPVTVTATWAPPGACTGRMRLACPRERTGACRCRSTVS